MSMTFDETSLYKLVLTTIQSGEFDDQDLSTLVDFIKERHLETLKAKGIRIPQSSVEGLETEIRDSIRTITYGYYSIKDYNKKRKGF